MVSMPVISLVALIFLLGGALYFFASNSSPKAAFPLRRNLAIFVGINIVLCVGIFGVAHEQGRFSWYEQQENLLPDIRTLLDSNTASDTIKALDTQEFLSAVGYYARVYPNDERAWRKLAITLVAVDIPDQALKALRRFLRAKPDDYEGRFLEIQLLAQLIDRQHKISPRQLSFALEKFAQHKDLSLNDRFQLAGVAQQYGFYGLAAEIWEAVLQKDQRPDVELTDSVREGRQLLTRLIVEARQKEAEGVSERKVIPIQAILSFTESAKEQIGHYFSGITDEQRRFQVWVSVKSDAGGPPLAAKLIWVDETGFGSNIEIPLTERDLLMSQRSWKPGDQLKLGVIIGLASEQRDPLQLAQVSQMQSNTLILLEESNQQAEVEINFRP